jgi:hypothetical protein
MEGIVAFLLAFGTALFASSLNVFLSWLLLFRSAEFRRQAAELEKKQKAVEELKSKDQDASDQAAAKKTKRLENDIAALTKELTSKNMKYTVISGGLLFLLNRIVRGYFDGVIVARIPFEPFSLLQKITHAGIENQEGRDGNFQFVYWLGTLLFRDALMRWFGFQMPQLGLAQQMANAAK